MDHNPDVLILLPGFRLPRDYPWRTGLVASLRRNREQCGYDWKHYQPPRFVGFYFNHAQPVGVCADGDAPIPLRAPIASLPAQIQAVTRGQFRIGPAPGETDPLYLLIHDGWNGDCWLRRFLPGLRFLTGRALGAEDEL